MHLTDLFWKVVVRQMMVRRTTLLFILVADAQNGHRRAVPQTPLPDGAFCA